MWYIIQRKIWVKFQCKSTGTVPQGEYQPQESPEFAENVARTFVADGRLYSIGRSELNVSQTVKHSGVCLLAVYLNANESGLLPDIGLSSIKWSVMLLRSGLGNSIQNPVEIDVTVPQPYDGAVMSANTYHAPNDRRLDIQWKALSSGLPNRAVVNVIARGETELGEMIKNTQYVSALCGLGAYSFSQIMDYSFRLMGEKGYKRELYKILPRIKGQDREWLEALGQYAEGARIN